MGSQFAWFYDVLLLGIIVCFIYMGAKKGFIRTLIMLVAYVVAMLGGFFISKAVAPMAYNAFIKAPLEQTVGDALKNVDVKKQINDLLKKQNINVTIPEADMNAIISKGGDLSANFAEYAKSKGATASESELKNQFSGVFNTESILSSVKDKIPGPIYQQVSTYLSGTQDSLTKIIQALNDPTSKQSSQTLTDIAIRPIAVLIIQLVLFIIVFTILMFVMRFVSKFINGVVKMIPLVGPVNSLLGAAFGLLQGVFVVLIIAIVLKLIIELSSNQLMFFNTPTVDKTFLFKNIYNFGFIK